MATYDVTDLANVKPLGLFEVSELDSPFARAPGARFGAHQFHERPTSTLVHAVWFSAGLRIVDVALDGASVSLDYENQFGRVLRKDGADALIGKMQARLAEAQKAP